MIGSIVALAHATPMVPIDGGRYTPLYGEPETSVDVDAFELDAFPVTNREYAAFVQRHPKWSRSRIAPLFAETSYLSHWEGDSEPGPAAPPDSPVTHVSWFAARAYCRSRGARLPTLDEWEYVARANATSRDAVGTAGFERVILDWYAAPGSLPLPPVGTKAANAWGVHDLHGLVWEWVEDFNSVIGTGESRKDGSIDRKLFCAAGAVGAVDPADYAAFVRYATRSSLEARHTMKTLGFRCAKDSE